MIPHARGAKHPQIETGGHMSRRLLFIAITTAALAGSAQAQVKFIAGVHPDRRPEGAPVIASYPKDAAWYRRALTGIVPPYPASLRFLEDQGAWFTPFIHPGMTGPYDIRGWHRAQ